MPADNPTEYQSDDTAALLDLARANAQALVIATASYFDLMQLPTADWTRFLGEVFSSSWDAVMELDAGAFIEAMLTNYQSFGATIHSYRLGADNATARIRGFPNPDLCDELNCNCDLADAYFDVPLPLARRFDLRWSWTRVDDRVDLHVTRENG
jgi:hypothetical protein